MERQNLQRQLELRFQPDQPVRFQVLSGTRRPVNARIVKLEGGWAHLQLEEPVASGSAVRIDMEDSLLLGELVACWSDSGKFSTMIRLQDAIPSLSDLGRLVSAVLTEGRASSPVPSAETPISTAVRV